MFLTIYIEENGEKDRHQLPPVVTAFSAFFLLTKMLLGLGLDAAGSLPFPRDVQGVGRQGFLATFSLI